MAIIEFNRSECPNCKHTLFRGPLAIGPSVVRCKKCGKQVITDMDSWFELTLSEKFTFVISEILAPSFLGDKSFFGRLCTNAIICLFAAIPFILSCITENSQSSVSEKLISSLISFSYEGYLFIRILRLRNQSMIYYTKTGVIPRW